MSCNVFLSVIWRSREKYKEIEIAKKYLEKYKEKLNYDDHRWYYREVLKFFESIVNEKSFFEGINGDIWQFSIIGNFTEYYEFIELIKYYFKELYEKEILIEGKYEGDRVLILVEVEQTYKMKIFNLYFDEYINDIVIIENYISDVYICI